MTWSPLMTHIMENTVDRSSRGGVRIDSIGHHHSADPSLANVLSAFQPGGREVTPNYCVWEDQIWGIVDEDYRAWTSASAQDDARSITYEIVNLTGGPGWFISPKTKATVAKLDAELSARYGIPKTHAIPGYWEHRNLNEWFGRSYATACAGPDFDIDNMIRAASAVGSGQEEGEESMSFSITSTFDGTVEAMSLNTGIRVNVGSFKNAELMQRVKNSKLTWTAYSTGYAFNEKLLKAELDIVAGLIRAINPPLTVDPALWDQLVAKIDAADDDETLSILNAIKAIKPGAGTLTAEDVDAILADNFAKIGDDVLNELRDRVAS